MTRSLVVVVTFAASACFLAQQPHPQPGPERPTPDEACNAVSEALIALPPGNLSFRAGQGPTCIPGTQQCGNATSCTVNVGDVAIGSDEVVVVTIQNFNDVSVDVSSITVRSASPDWYVEGQPPNVVPPKSLVEVSLVLRPSIVGACDGDLVVSSDASNQPRDNVALSLHANCVAGTAPGCSTSGACCCANGATSGDPSCDEHARVSCATGFVAFDDACNEAPCAP